jgi:hypothetical protein
MYDKPLPLFSASLGVRGLAMPSLGKEKIDEDECEGSEASQAVLHGTPCLLSAREFVVQ